jgi:hypothetical protein
LGGTPLNERAEAMLDAGMPVPLVEQRLVGLGLTPDVAAALVVKVLDERAVRERDRVARQEDESFFWSPRAWVLRKKERVYAVALLVALAGLYITVSKLYKMAQVKGWIAGAVVTQEVITQKGVNPARRLRDTDSYWVSWVDGDVGRSWEKRVRVPADTWERMRLGDPIELIRVSGDSYPYLKEGVGVQTGNFVFDLMLLVAEVTVAVVMSYLLIRKYRESSIR